MLEFGHSVPRRLFFDAPNQGSFLPKTFAAAPRKIDYTQMQAFSISFVIPYSPH